MPKKPDFRLGFFLFGYMGPKDFFSHFYHSGETFVE